MGSADPTLAAIAAKSEKESAYHLRHSAEWVIRLGDGTEESHARAGAAVEELWPYTGEMFLPDDGESDLVRQGVAVDPESLRETWSATVAAVLAEATLTMPPAGWTQRGGREGRHSEHLGHLLSELQYPAAQLSGGEMVTAWPHLPHPPIASRRAPPSPRGEGNMSRGPFTSPWGEVEIAPAISGEGWHRPLQYLRRTRCASAPGRLRPWWSTRSCRC